MRKFLALLAALTMTFGAVSLPVAAQQGSALSYVVGERNASWYAFGRGPILGAFITSGNTGTGAQTITVCPAILALPDGRTVNILGGTGLYPVPLLIDAQSSTNSETVTPTAVTLTGPQQLQGSNQQVPCANVTATFSYTHPASQNTHQVISGDFGLQEAINDAGIQGGAITVGPDWQGTNAMLTAAGVFQYTSIIDKRSGTPRIWNPTPTGLAVAAPTLPAVNIAGQLACDATHQMCSDASVAGSASWGGAVYACWAYVDILGNEGPCSATTNWTSAASKAIDLGIPAASPGAVGAVPYLSLSGGTYILAYQIPVTSSVCTMTKLETITPACAVANTTFGQAGSTYGADTLFTTGGAQITTYPLSTAQLAPVLATTANTLTGQHTFTNSAITYSYAPGARTGACGGSSLNLVQQNAAGGINGSSATTVPNPIASWTVPANCFNYIGAEFRITGKWTYTDGGDSSTRLIVAWDSNGTNTASVPTPLCNVLDTATGTGAAYNGTYTCTVRILTTGTGGTAVVNGYATQNLAAGATTLVRNGADTAVAASAAINLATNARITVWFEGVGATNNPGAQGLDATLEVLN